MSTKDRIANAILFAYEADDLSVPDALAEQATADFIEFVTANADAVNQYLSNYDLSQLPVDYVLARQGFGGFPLITGSTAKDILDSAVRSTPALAVPRDLTDRISTVYN